MMQSSIVELARAELASLPFDILHMIVWDEKLSQDDVRALRLSCRALSEVAATRLFYRIAISKLNVDRKAFLSTCHSPHLALHVHEVEWLEISWDADLFDRIAHQFFPAPKNEDDRAAICSYLHDQAKECFWMANVPVFTDDFSEAADIEAARQTAVQGFRDVFEAAIGMLPNLHTFVSRPMTTTRVINPDSKYPMTAGLFQRFQSMNLSRLSSQLVQTNDGLVLFLAPTMGRPASTVTRLRWADEFPGFSYLRSFPAAAFEGLESMELCLTPGPLGLEISVDHLEAACARAAPTLRHLRLCVEHAAPNATLGIMDKAILGPALVESPVCTLRSLSLVAVRCSTDTLFHIIEANASSLRHVYLETVTVKAKLIQRLAQLTPLQLDTLQVVDHCSYLHCERALVRFINGEEPTKESFCCPFDKDFWESWEANYCDTALRKHMERDSDNQIVTAHRFPYSDSIDSGSDADSDSPEDSVASRFRAAPKWMWARFFSTNDEEDPPLSCIYCYQVPDSHPKGHATKYWKFTSRSGETAYGDDPLEWFEDWDLEAGDVEEPTPYCDVLRRFFSEDNDIVDIIDSIHVYLGEGSKAWDLIKEQKPPQDAFYYDPEEDPTRSSNMFDLW